MEKPGADEYIERFVVELIRTGSVLRDLMSNLVDALPSDAYPGEDPAIVVVEMLCGTIATALWSVEERDVQRATELMSLAEARVFEHLQLASKMSRQIHQDGGAGRRYG